MSNPPPGWYPDPSGQQRWWDGQQWGQAAGPPPTSSTDPKTMAMLAHALAIVAGFLAPLIIYLVYGNQDPFIRHHSAESLNFQITVLLAVLVSAALICVFVGIILLPVVVIGALVFEIMAAMAANRGEWYRYPINIRMVSGAVDA